LPPENWLSIHVKLNEIILMDSTEMPPKTAERTAIVPVYES
jgi:hypothetical protein